MASGQPNSSHRACVVPCMLGLLAPRRSLQRIVPPVHLHSGDKASVDVLFHNRAPWHSFHRSLPFDIASGFRRFPTKVTENCKRANLLAGCRHRHARDVKTPCCVQSVCCEGSSSSLESHCCFQRKMSVDLLSCFVCSFEQEER